MSFKKSGYYTPAAEAVEEEKEEVVEVKEEKKVEPKKEQPAKKPAVPQIAKVLPDLCNIRKTPNANADIVKVVPKNAEFRVNPSKSTDDYVAISIEGDVAFIRRDLVTVFDNPAYNAGELAMKIGGR